MLILRVQNYHQLRSITITPSDSVSRNGKTTIQHSNHVLIKKKRQVSMLMIFRQSKASLMFSIMNDYIKIQFGSIRYRFHYFLYPTAVAGLSGIPLLVLYRFDCDGRFLQGRTSCIRHTLCIMLSYSYMNPSLQSLLMNV